MIAQRVYKYNLPGSDCYSEMVFEEKVTSPKGIIVIDVKGQDIVTYNQNNVYVNSGLFQNYNFLYLNILNKGGASSVSCLDVVIRTVASTHRIYMSAFYVIVNSTNTKEARIQKANEDGDSFNLLYDGSIENEALLKLLDNATNNKAYKVPLNIVVSGDLEREAKMKNYNRNFDIGIYLAPTFLNDSKIGLKKNAITTYGLSFAKNISSLFTIKANAGGSFKKPDQSSIQSAIRSKMQEAIKNGDSTIVIDQTLSGHIMFGGDIALKYYFAKTKAFRPYISLGMGSYAVTNISGRIQDTIDISGIDPQNPSSMQSALGGSLPSSDGAGMTTTKTSFLVPQFETGFEYRLSPVVKVNVSMPFKYFIDKSTTNLNTFTYGFNFGLSFTINPNKYKMK